MGPVSLKTGQGRDKSLRKYVRYLGKPFSGRNVQIYRNKAWIESGAYQADYEQHW